MAKILVADDNSNIQKMVGLALKDQGIDVVAVGNGEAAVRKISDVRPDLVLADVFMPVRNGYEVCQFVKADSALAHIPVILLVGAFDPLDEQEAQRVGADGVLKKPFVPPDPLISMVKSALIRAGVSLGGVTAPPPAPKEEPPRVAEMLAPRVPPSSINLPALEGFPPADAEPIGEELPSRPEPVRIDAGSQPLAFGSLLETPTAEQEDDLAFATTTPRPELERDWKSGEDEEEEVAEEDQEKNSSWRRDAGDAREETVEREAAPSGPARDWRETAFSEGPGRKSHLSAWTPQKEISTLEEAAETVPSVAAAVSDPPVAETRAPEVTRIPEPQVTETHIPEPKYTPTPITMPSFGATPEPPFSKDAWAAALEPKASTPAATETPVVDRVEEVSRVEVRAESFASAPVIEMPAPPASDSAPSAAPEVKKAGDSWFSAVSSPWDAEVKKASQLASTWDAPAAAAIPVAPVVPVTPEASTFAPATTALEPEPLPVLSSYASGPDPVIERREDPGATVDSLPASLSEDVRAKVEEAGLPAGTVEALREETHQVTDTVILQKPVVSAPAVAEPAKTASPSMEDLVAKVLAQMSPEMLQAVTREILKPVVEAMVRDEINAKK